MQVRTFVTTLGLWLVCVPAANAQVEPRDRTVADTPSEPDSARCGCDLYWAGGLMLGVSSVGHGALAGASIFASSLSWSRDRTRETADAWAMVPVVGPWIQFGMLGFSAGGLWASVMVLSGLLQATGLSMLVAGAVVDGRPRAPEVAVVPLLGPHTVGLAARGRL